MTVAAVTPSSSTEVEDVRIRPQSWRAVSAADLRAWAIAVANRRGAK